MDWWLTVTALVMHLGPTEDDHWARVLTGLDLQRAQAFAAADPDLLARVYGPGAGETDAATIQDYARRGAHVDGALLVVESVRLVRRDDRVVLDVVDRLGPAVVVWDDGSRTRLPRDRATRREVVLVTTPEGWRIASSRVRPR